MCAVPQYIDTCAYTALELLILDGQPAFRMLHTLQRNLVLSTNMDNELG